VICEIACGIDVGFSATDATSGVSVFSVERAESVACTVRVAVLSPTRVMTAAGVEMLVTGLRPPFDNPRLRLVTFDAPATRTLHAAMPPTGRLPDRRFSRGLFTNSKRGPQPSSIRVPKQGWPLYQRGMKLVALLCQAGFGYVILDPKAHTQELPARASMEVLPKLTLSLLCPRDLLAVKRPEVGFYGQIDNWLFAHVFVREAAVDKHGVRRGSARDLALELLGPTITIDASVFDEADRIDAIETQGEKHEAIGAFVAGFQGALAVAASACAVGDNESHFLLPRRWHADWEAAWLATERRREPAGRVEVRP
jgi:hypothetical protein